MYRVLVTKSAQSSGDKTVYLFIYLQFFVLYCVKQAILREPLSARLEKYFLFSNNGNLTQTFEGGFATLW